MKKFYPIVLVFLIFSVIVFSNIKTSAQCNLTGPSTADQLVCPNQSVTPLSVTLSCSGESAALQWFSQTAGSYAWTKIDGATGSTYTPTSSPVKTYYRVEATTSIGGFKSYSDVSGGITFAQPVTSVTYQPSDPSPTYCKDGITPLSIAITGGGPMSYKWYTSTPGTPPTPNSPADWTLLQGASSASLMPGNGTFKIEATDGCWSDSKTWTVNITSLITGQPLSWQQVCPNTPLTLLSVTAQGATGYQWYNGYPSSSTLISGAIASSYTPPVTASTTNYYVVVSGSGCTETSQPATVWVQPTPTISYWLPCPLPQPSPTSLFTSQNSGLQLFVSGCDPSNGNMSLQWYRNTANSNTGGAPIATSFPFSPTAAPGTYYYYAEVSSCNGITKSNVSLPITVTSSPTLCINTTLTDISITTPNAVGIPFSGVPGANGLPPGVSARWAPNTITISGTPTAAGTFNYSIPLMGASCGAFNATGTIIVKTNTAGPPSSSPTTLCINTPLTNITINTTGATGIANSGVSGANGLPPGVSATWANNTITISGTPTWAGNFNYSIPLTGGCGSVKATGTITVNINTAWSPSSSPTLCINTPLTNITINTSGATGILNSGVSGANGLPLGVSATWASNKITISGTPTAAGTFNYSIPLTGGCGSVNATGTITVNATNTAGAPSSTPSLCINTALSNVTIATTGATGISNSGVSGANGLPSGVSATWASNAITISGMPSASGTFNYSIPLTGGCGSVNATGTIMVNPTNTVGSPSSTPTLCINTALTNITVTTTGATGISNSGVSGANGLPPGVSATWSSNTITINGTPTAAGTFNYSIPLTGGCGIVNASGTIIVSPTNTAGTPSSSPTLCINTALTNINITTTGATGILNNGVSGANGLPPGVSATWASNTITISGTPTAAGTFNYSIPLTGGCGIVNATGTITVNTNTAGAPSSSPTLCINTALTNINITTTGATGILNNGVSGANGLPPGVSATWASNTITISGTPNAAGTFNYSIPLTGGCGIVNANGTIIVNSSTSISSQNTPAQIRCLNGTATAMSITSSGTGPFTYKWYSNPTNSNSGGTLISGATSSSYTPPTTSVGIKYYYVIDSGACGSVKSAVSGAITVNSPTVSITASPGLNLCKTGYTTLTATATGATSYSWSSSYGDYSGDRPSLTVYDEETYTVDVLISGCGHFSASRTTTRTGTLCGIARVAADRPTPLPVVENEPGVSEMTAFPNPATDKITVAMPTVEKEDTPVSLYNIFGDLLTSGTIKKGEWKTELSVTNCAEGLHIVRVGNGDLLNAVKLMVMRK